MPQTRIFLSGDSSTYGYGDPECGGWGARLKTRMMERSAGGEIPAREVVNFAISSQSIEQIAMRLPDQVASFPPFPGIGIFMIGAVESVVRPGHTGPRVERPDFIRALNLISKTCMTHTVSPIFVGYHQVDEGRTNPWHNGDRYTNTGISAYNAVAKAHADATGVPYIDLYEIGQNLNAYLAEDGLHPSSAGHQLIAAAVEPVVDSVLKTQM